MKKILAMASALSPFCTNKKVVGENEEFLMEMIVH
jgi:hypothetical protein